LKDSPTLRAAISDIDAATAEKENAKSRFYPSFDVQMNARTGNDLSGVDGRNTSAAALVVMNWNLYRGGADTARVREFAFRHEQSKSANEKTRRDLENDVRQTWASMVAAGERAKQFETQASANQQVVDAYKDQFSLDRRTLLDVLDSQNELFVTRSNTVNAEFLEMFAVYRLMALKGSLLPSLGVEYPAIDKLAFDDTSSRKEDVKKEDVKTR
jgi:adhesin transport system outer membrane protein